MKAKQTIGMGRIVLLLIFCVFFGVAFSPTTFAADLNVGGAPSSGDASKCEGATTVLKSACKDGVSGLLNLVLDIMTAGIGIAAVGGIAYGGFLYTTAGGSQEQVKKAKGVIQNVIIGLVAYVGVYALIQYLIPGGIF